MAHMSILTSDLSTLVPAIERLRRELPGWWFSVCECQVSCDASLAPLGDGPDADLIGFRDQEEQFDSGFHVDLSQPSTLGEALNEAINDAVAARARFKPSRAG